MDMTMEQELELAYREAYSIESMPSGHHVERVVGMKEYSDGSLHEFVQDDTGAYWFRSFVRRDGRIITTDEAVFGREYVERNRRAGKGWIYGTTAERKRRR